MLFARRHGFDVHCHCLEEMQKLFQVDHLYLFDFSRLSVNGYDCNLHCRLPQPLDVVGVPVNHENHLVAVAVDASSGSENV